jgi:hypothetical protein
MGTGRKMGINLDPLLSLGRYLECKGVELIAQLVDLTGNAIQFINKIFTGRTLPISPGDMVIQTGCHVVHTIRTEAYRRYDPGGCLLIEMDGIWHA